ncbi:LOW QUALITY PROTEIN: hypothetical protein T265_15331 [Opisthorchis viverrini]|uniref:Uncharacterized protein n=1 Tax=Opisthorchis viverrini TaxID=6198 RepID=A0A074ZYV8_OPIVI|nr:LOW QUALITY PROTEIN: hypothetical protein T265_15331 [Opisthorchis viverrini]KER20374.1 LOW QUALITY PROTEIN: hypothetical protein T265_15331 [Opisthorchis viverrini]
MKTQMLPAYAGGVVAAHSPRMSNFELPHEQGDALLMSSNKSEARVQCSPLWCVRTMIHTKMAWNGSDSVYALLMRIHKPRHKELREVGSTKVTSRNPERSTTEVTKVSIRARRQKKPSSHFTWSSINHDTG